MTTPLSLLPASRSAQKPTSCVMVCLLFACWLVACLTSQQHASVAQGRICSDNFKCCHTEIEVADQTLHFTQSQYTDTGPTNPSTDPITSGAWQGSCYKCQFQSHWYDSTPEKFRRKRDSNPGSSTLEADALTTRPTRRSMSTVLKTQFLGSRDIARMKDNRWTIRSLRVADKGCTISRKTKTSLER